MNNVLLITFFFEFLSCSARTSIQKAPEVKTGSGIKVYYDLPFQYDATGEPIKYEQFYVKLFKLGSFFFYELPFVYQESINEVTKEEQRKYMFIFHRDSLYGKYINKWNLSENKRLKVDSFLQSETFSTLNVEQNWGRLNLRMISQEVDSTKDQILRKYKLTSKADSNDVTISLFHYVRNFSSDISFTLSRELDTIPGYKLCRVDFYPMIKRTTADGATVNFKFTLQLNEERVDNTELLYYLELYNKTGSN